MSSPVILYDNILDDTTSLSVVLITSLATSTAATDSDTNFNVLNIIDKREYTLWQGTSSTGFYEIRFDSGQTTTMKNAFGMAGHNLGSAGGQLTILNSSNPTFAPQTRLSSVSLPGYAPTDDNPILLDLTTLNNARRYWMIRIYQPTTVAVKLGVAMIGDKLTIPDQEKRDINPQAHQVVSEGFESRAIFPLGVDVRGSRFERSVEYQGVASTWIRDSFLPAWSTALGKNEPFFFAWNTAVESTYVNYVQVRPNSAFVSNYRDDTDYRTLQMTLTGKYND